MIDFGLEVEKAIRRHANYDEVRKALGVGEYDELLVNLELAMYGNFTVARLVLENSKPSYGFAKCKPGDNYDAAVGARIAIHRAVRTLLFDEIDVYATGLEVDL